MPMDGLEPRILMAIRIDRIDKEKLEMLAAADRKSLSEYVRLVLEKHIKAKQRGEE